MNDEMNIQVTDEFEIGDMSDVQGDVLPPASKVLFVVKKASIGSLLLDNKQAESDENPVVLKKLRLELRIKEGIEQGGQIKYVNKPCFVDMFVWHNPVHKTSDYYKTRKYLLDFKQFIKAMGYDVKAPPKMNDQFLIELIDREVRGDIQQKPIQVNDGSGKWVNTDEMENKYRNWRTA